MFDFYNDLESALGFGTLCRSRFEYQWIFQWDCGKFQIIYRVRVDQIDTLLAEAGSPKEMARRIGLAMREQMRQTRERMREGSPG
jgi:hypothetical protein